MLLQTSQLFDSCSKLSFFIISKRLSKINHVGRKSLFFALSQKKPGFYLRNLVPRSSLSTFYKTSAKMAASAEKDKSADEKKVKSLLAEAVARYNYCLMTHPVLTKSVTRQVLLIEDT